MRRVVLRAAGVSGAIDDALVGKRFNCKGLAIVSGRMKKGKRIRTIVISQTPISKIKKNKKRKKCPSKITTFE